MTKNLNERKSEIFKVLSNPVRLEILEILCDGEKCVCELQQKLEKYEQPHISKSLAKLKSAGLIQARREGMNTYYSISLCCIKEFLSCLNKCLSN